MKPRNRPLKVAYLGVKGLPGRGGAERVVEALVRRMPACGFNPIVYCDRSHTPSVYSLDKTQLVRLPAAQGKHTRAVSLDLLAAVHAVAFGDYDLIHLHHAEASFVLPLLRLRYPVVSTSHGSAYLHAKWGPVARWLMRAMDLPFAHLPSAVTCVSAEGAKSVERRFGRAVAYIPNGVGDEVAPDLERGEAYLRELGLMPHRYFLFVAARMGPTKGPHLAIEAVNQLGPSFPLLVIGDLIQAPSYTRELQAMGGPHILFRPSIEEPGLLYGLMAQAMGVIFPSMAEAMSMVLLEAASLGVPMVASDIQANRDVLGPEAIYFACGDADALSERLRFLLEHPEQARACAKSIQDRVRQGFSWDEIALRYAQIYREVCNGHGST